MEEKDLSVSYVTNPDVVLREEDDDGGLLFNPDTNQIRVINSTGLFIWKMCDGKNSLSDIISALHESFEAVPQEEVKNHVQSLIDDLKTHEFVLTGGTRLL